MSHTPKWTWRPSRTQQHLHDELGGTGVSMPVPPSKAMRSQSVANLIAAAPDLLAALEDSVIAFCDATCPTVWKTAEHEGRPHGPRCKANYAAIAKARGTS